VVAVSLKNGLFAAALYRMHIRYAQAKGWKMDTISLNESGIGSLKEIIFEVGGREPTAG
jgi:peptide chain release factor 1